MRRVLVDTNVIVAAVGFPGGIAARAFWQVVNEDDPVFAAYVLDEVNDVVSRKWPHLLTSAESLLTDFRREFREVETSGIVIRDPKDQPALDAAIVGRVEIILTGDKDFHALAVSEPLILTPRQYLEMS